MDEQRINFLIKLQLQKLDIHLEHEDGEIIVRLFIGDEEISSGRIFISSE